MNKMIVKINNLKKKSFNTITLNYRKFIQRRGGSKESILSRIKGKIEIKIQQREEIYA